MLLRYGKCNASVLPPDNRLELNDGTYRSIDNPLDFCLNGSTSGTVTFVSEGESVSVTKTMIERVYLEIPGEGASNDQYCRYLFYGYSNCKAFNIKFVGVVPQTVGTYFCAQMFYGLPISGDEISSSFVLPRTITRCGVGFYYYMFGQCLNLANVPAGILLPNLITSAGQSFCYRMFQGAGNIILPDAFTLPQDMAALPVECFGYMFYNSGLIQLPSGFRLPANMSTIGGNSCISMFEGTRLLELPDGFSFPRNIIGSTLPITVFRRMFANTPLQGVPEGFNLPVNYTGAAGGSYFDEMFYNCPNIMSDPSLGVAINFIHASTDFFGGTTPAVPDSPASGDTVYIQPSGRR